MNLQEISQGIIQQGVLPIYFNPDPEITVAITSSLAEGGMRFLEMTNRGENALDVFKQVIDMLSDKHPQVCLGAGSIADRKAAEEFHKAGAAFLVSPFFDGGVNDYSLEQNLLYVPGCATPTEIHQAEAAGVTFFKLFPAGEIGGPSFVKNILAPCPHWNLLATGGVQPDQAGLTSWFTAGIKAVGMGSKLISKEIIASGEYARLTAQASRLLELIRNIRK